MINKDFYPTDRETIELMIGHLDLFGKTVYEPSAERGYS